jgi:GNAT superfamily N-acetyltransferase
MPPETFNAPKFYIRKVDLREPANVTLLCYLQKKILPEDEIYKPERGHWWIAYTEAGKPVGFAGLVRSIKWTDTGYLCRAGVLESFTGFGLQKRLIKVRQQQAKKLGWNWLITDTTNNPASSNSLISCGFKMYTPANPWSFKNACYWKYKVNPDALQRRERKKKQKQGVQP